MAADRGTEAFSLTQHRWHRHQDDIANQEARMRSTALRFAPFLYLCHEFCTIKAAKGCMSDYFMAANGILNATGN